MEKLIDRLIPTLKETNSFIIVRNLFNEIIEQASDYLKDENIIGLYVECNAPLKQKSHDSFDISNNKKPLVSLVAVYDQPDDKYKSAGDSVTFNIKNCNGFGNYDFATYYISSSNYDINEYKSFVAYRASISLLRGIILYDKYGLLTEAQDKLPTVLNERLVTAYSGIQDIKMNKALSKKLPIIGTRICK